MRDRLDGPRNLKFLDNVFFNVLMRGETKVPVKTPAAKSHHPTPDEGILVWSSLGALPKVPSNLDKLCYKCMIRIAYGALESSQ